MIPNGSALGEIVRERLPGATFYLEEDMKVVRGMVDGHEAVRQAAWFILHTERFRYVIYSFDYGTELQGLGGSRDSFLFPEIKRRVTEALLVDDRIIGASEFVFDRQKSRVAVRFLVHTIYGETEMELEV